MAQQAQRHADVIRTLFEHVVEPPITVSAAGLIDIPEQFTIRMRGSARIYKLLSDPQLFCSQPAALQKGILDVLHLVMIRGPYDVIRFQCHGMEDQTYQTEGLTRILLKLIKHIQKQQQQGTGRWENHPSTKRIIHLLGLSSSAGISTADLRDFLMLLREPSDVSLSLLQALKTMIRHDNAIVKAAPASFFNLGGEGAGLVAEKAGFPFSKEYQFCTWFRVEKFATIGDRAEVQHVVSVLNDAGYGIDVFLRDKLLHISMAFTKGAEAQVLVLRDTPLKRGVWYHLCIRHTKPRINLFSRDEFVVHVDHQLVFQDNIRFPAPPSLLDEVEFCVGRNFDGQISPIYFFGESLAPSVIEAIARIDAGKPHDGLNHGLNNVIVDLLPVLTSADRKVNPISSKVLVSYHPGRVVQDVALDIFSSRHARAAGGGLTQAWNITSARDVLNSIGGVSCLLPLFPRLLIDRPLSGEESASGSVVIATSHNELLGSSWGDASDHEALSLLEPSVRAYLLADIAETDNDTPVGLLLTVLAKCITSHKIYQTELVNMSGVEMIEYALTCVPDEALRVEGEGCILALLLLRSAVADCPPL
jgi:hypothetical protein